MSRGKAKRKAQVWVLWGTDTNDHRSVLEIGNESRCRRAQRYWTAQGYGDFDIVHNRAAISSLTGRD